MSTRKYRTRPDFSPKVIVLAMLVAYGPAYAENDDVAVLTNPNVSDISVGLGSVSGNESQRSIFGQYSGYAKNPDALLLDFQLIRRDDAGLWTKAEGSDLGLDDRDLNFSQEKQGSWKYSLDYSELVHRDITTINTGLQGAGTASPTVSGLAATGTGGNLNLEQKRKDFTLDGAKWITPSLSFEASFKNEEKEGARQFGVGGYCSNAISPLCSGATSTVAAYYLLPVPVNSSTQQFEAKLNYFGDRYSVTGGYYGSFYNNSNSVMTPNGIGAQLGAGATQAALAANLSQPLSLSPDNQAHQVYVLGNYALQPTTHLNYKVAYTHATQDEGFGVLGAGSLNGEVNTTFAQFGLTARPMPKLSLNANVRYENRDDQTPLGNYVISNTGALYTNSPDNWTRINSKLEAAYQMTSVYRALLGVDYAYVNRDRPASTTLIPADSMAALRERTNEWGIRAELRRAMSDDVNATVSIGHSKREGYHWYELNPATGYAFISYANASALSGTFPVTLLDRSRDTVKLMTDWAPNERLSLQFSLEGGKDSYQGPTDAGMQDSNTFSINMDVAYRLTNAWKITGYASSGRQAQNMQQGVGYTANLVDTSTTVGLGAAGQINAKLEIGGDLTFVRDKDHYNLGMTTGAAVANLPDSSYSATTLKLHAKYLVDKTSDVRVDVISQHAKFDSWTWLNFAYSDNTTVSLNPTQNIVFLGARYTYHFK
jgi:MtrB/PioB family decaheme-associated outer membrane protein